MALEAGQPHDERPKGLIGGFIESFKKSRLGALCKGFSFLLMSTLAGHDATNKPLLLSPVDLSVFAVNSAGALTDRFCLPIQGMSGEDCNGVIVFGGKDYYLHDTTLPDSVTRQTYLDSIVEGPIPGPSDNGVQLQLEGSPDLMAFNCLTYAFIESGLGEEIALTYEHWTPGFSVDFLDGKNPSQVLFDQYFNEFVSFPAFENEISLTHYDQKLSKENGVFPGDILVIQVGHDKKNWHAAVVVEHEGQNWLQQKMGEGPVLLLPPFTVFLEYVLKDSSVRDDPSSQVVVYRRK